jgi:hypothetical protein
MIKYVIIDLQQEQESRACMFWIEYFVAMVTKHFPIQLLRLDGDKGKKLFPHPGRMTDTWISDGIFRAKDVMWGFQKDSRPTWNWNRREK